MPKTLWFKKIWNCKKNKKYKDKGKLYRTRRMKSFRINNSCNIRMKAYDLSGQDVSHYLRYSFIYNGIPGGFYLDEKKMKEDGYLV